jgi:hypothetical protein
MAKSQIAEWNSKTEFKNANKVTEEQASSASIYFQSSLQVMSKRHPAITVVNPAAANQLFVVAPAGRSKYALDCFFHS